MRIWRCGAAMEWNFARRKVSVLSKKKKLGVRILCITLVVLTVLSTLSYLLIR